MRDLRPPFEQLGAEILGTILHVHRERAKDYDLNAIARGVELLLQKYELKLRAVPLERSEILKPEPVCVVCSLPLGSHVREGARLVPGEDRVRMHPECVAERKP